MLVAKEAQRWITVGHPESSDMLLYLARVNEHAVLRTVGSKRWSVSTFSENSESRDLRALLRRGRTALIIGLVFLSSCVVLGDILTPLLHATRVKDVVIQGLTVAASVAMWRPMEVFLYAWWPIARDRRLHERLSAMPTSISVTGSAPSV
jgi:hypothetical protein